ncbi:MAG: hypothetical protein HQL32_12415 [Planctomycetes bacterium]|nr:hypothetical protein [Planctomycetota bacterium]
MADTLKRLLHINFAFPEAQELPDMFQAPDWSVVTMESHAQADPDILCDIRSLHLLEQDNWHAIYLANQLNRYERHQLPQMIKGLYNLLNEQGIVLVEIPHVKVLAEYIYKKGWGGQIQEGMKLSELVYGHEEHIRKSLPRAQIRSAFSPNELGQLFLQAGFEDVAIRVRGLSMILRGVKKSVQQISQGGLRIDEVDVNDKMKMRDLIEKDPELPVKWQPSH